MARMHKGRTVAKHNALSVINCDTCGFKHVHPVPTREELAKIYPKEYYETENPDWVEKTLREQEYWDLVYNERYDVLEGLVPADSRRILDVGSFLGLFLGRGKARGWRVLGIEPSEQGVRFAKDRGVETWRGFFEDFSGGELGTFGAVNLALTLEHVTDPGAVLKKAREILQPGGVVCIEVPNDFSPMQDAVRKALEKEVYWPAPPHHINYFDFESLAGLLQSSGFEIAHKTATFPMEFFLMMGEDYLGNDPVGHTCHARRMRFEMNLARGGLGDFKRSLYEFFAQHGIGREVVLYGRNPDVGKDAA